MKLSECAAGQRVFVHLGPGKWIVVEVQGAPTDNLMPVRVLHRGTVGGYEVGEELTMSHDRQVRTEQMMTVEAFLAIEPGQVFLEMLDAAHQAYMAGTSPSEYAPARAAVQAALNWLTSPEVQSAQSIHRGSGSRPPGA